MAMFDGKSMRENELSLPSKFICVLAVLGAFFSAGYNIYNGIVKNPYAFSIPLLGFILFVISKSSLLRNKIWLSFGTKKMSENMGNLYRVGYWLMIVGIILTFTEIIL